MIDTDRFQACCHRNRHCWKELEVRVLKNYKAHKTEKTRIN